MSQTTIYQLSQRSKDKTQKSRGSIVRDKYFEAQLQTKIFFQLKWYNYRITGETQTKSA